MVTVTPEQKNWHSQPVDIVSKSRDSTFSPQAQLALDTLDVECGAAAINARDTIQYTYVVCIDAIITRKAELQ